MNDIQPELWVDRGAAAVAFYKGGLRSEDVTSRRRKTMTSSPNSPLVTPPS
jgi:hypothetical protein